MPKRVATGRVTSAAASKTRRVEVPRIVRHKKYGRILHRRTVCHVHDEEEESAPGDLVEIIECRPRSRTKRWELVRVVAKSTAVDVASLRSGARATSIKETAARTEEAAATGEEARTGGADSAGAGEEATT
jgi:small subunit ribosomal protein S17